MSTLPSLSRFLCRKAMLKRSLAVAAFVGTLLNAINQGPAVLRGLDVSWSHALLNYLVPFFVSAAKAENAASTGVSNM